MVRRQLQTMSHMEREDPPALKMMGQSQWVELMAREFTVANGAALTSDDGEHEQDGSKSSRYVDCIGMLKLQSGSRQSYDGPSRVVM